MANDICLEFANTADWHAGPHPEETLTSYGKAVDWAKRGGLLSEGQAQRLLAEAGDDLERQAEALRRIIALREAVYGVFSAVANDHSPDPEDLQVLDRELTVALAHLRLAAADPGTGGAEPAGSEERVRFVWALTGMEEDLTSMLWPVARAATTLLTSPELGRVRQCADEQCGWLFLDESRNASRRWCDMADCGNRAKARRYRERKRADSGTEPS
jgi:predicted RNA-binding Zn ribbon-like protein